MLSTTLVRDHQFKVIWVKVYVAVHHIGPPKSRNRVSKTDREVITALERKGSRGCSARRGGWSLNARNVAKSGSDQQGAGSSVGKGGKQLHVTDHVGVTTVKNDN